MTASLTPDEAVQPEVIQVVDHLFRREAAKLVATLTRLLGSETVQLAEDVVGGDGEASGPRAPVHPRGGHCAGDSRGHRPVAEAGRGLADALSALQRGLQGVAW